MGTALGAAKGYWLPALGGRDRVVHETTNNGNKRKHVEVGGGQALSSKYIISNAGRVPTS
ncbi:hypothetical protein WG66_015667 [Moniliophthora roreri]|nr:hypothetical protein WG66_015667 [Moniliophthora roreri]